MLKEIIQQIRDNSVDEIEISEFKFKNLFKGIDDKEIEILADVIRNNTSLKKLKIALPILSSKNIQSLIEAIKSNQSINELDLDFPFSDSKWMNFFGLCFKENSRFKRLSFGGPRQCPDTSYKDHGLLDFFQGLKTDKTLVSLQVDVSKKYIKPLCEALKQNNQLICLSITKTEIEKEDIECIGDLLKVNSSLQSFKLSHRGTVFSLIRGGDAIISKNTEESIRFIADALKVNAKLKIICLENISIGDRGAKYLSEALKVNTSLEYFSISSHHNIERMGIKAILESLSHNSSLIKFAAGRNWTYQHNKTEKESEKLQKYLRKDNNLRDSIVFSQELINISFLLEKRKNIVALNVTCKELEGQFQENMRLREEFWRAVQAGDLDKLALCLRQGISINTSRGINSDTNILSTDEVKFGNTALHLAIINNHYRVAEYLIKSGANLHIKNDEGKTPVQIAEEKNDLEWSTLFDISTHTVMPIAPAVVQTIPAVKQTVPKTSPFMPIPVPPAKLSASTAKAPSSFPLPSPKVTTLPITTAPSNPRIDATGNVTLSIAIPFAELSFETELGRGAFGVVYQGTWHDSPIAIKTLLLQDMKQDVLDNFIQEASVMVALKHPNIIQLSGITLDHTPYCMVMEFMENGSLYRYLHSARPLDFPLQVQIAMDIARGLSYLHSKLILHRDLKSLNVLLDDRLRAKLADFGLSKVRHQTMSQTAGKMVGTPQWMAPELFDVEDDTSKGNEKSDMYSYGMVLWELLARRDPFAGTHDPIQIAMRVLQGKRETIPPEAHPTFKQLIEQCWNKKAPQRPSAKDTLDQLQPLQPQRGSLPAVSASDMDYTGNLASGQPASSSSRMQSYTGNLASGQPIASNSQAKPGFFPPPPPPLGSYQGNLASGVPPTLPRPGKK